MIGPLLTFFAVGLVTLLVAGVVLSVVGVVFSLTFGLATFLLFKVAPILLVGARQRGAIGKLTTSDDVYPSAFPYGVWSYSDR